MNDTILNELINRYEDNLDMLYGEEHNELFKWKAMKTWQEEWFRPQADFSSFVDRFNAARKNFSLFIDNSQMHPSTGIVKLWEYEPDSVERLFWDVLFANAGGDISAAQENMDRFIAGYEQLRQKYFPSSWSYKQDRHSASVFLAMNDPKFHFVYKSGEATTMAKYIDFPYPIGTGSSFSLPNYYRLCETIISALKEHESLLQKHFEALKEEHYKDESLHLLAFDLMYCCHFYGFYHGLPIPSSKRKTKKIEAPELTPEELALLQEKRVARINEIEQEIEELERACDEYEVYSLLDVQVTAMTHGIGTVIEQDKNKIKVRFADAERAFVLHQKYTSRPHFENDEFIVAKFTEYAEKQEQIQKLQKELAAL